MPVVAGLMWAGSLFPLPCYHVLQKMGGFPWRVIRES